MLILCLYFQIVLYIIILHFDRWERYLQKKKFIELVRHNDKYDLLNSLQPHEMEATVKWQAQEQDSI